MSDPEGPRALGDGDNSNASTGHGPGPPSSDDVDREGAAGDSPSDGGEQGQPPDTGRGGEDDWALGQTDWVRTSENEDPERRRMLAAFLVGALAGIVILGLVWATTGLLAGTDSDRTATAVNQVTSTPMSGPSQEAQVSRSPSRLFSCRQADLELARLLQATGPAMDQWEVHIGAMNKLVVGAITLQQATAFWNQTRVGAKRNLERFRSLMHEIPFPGVGCPSPAGRRQASTELGACAQRVAHERQALEAARTAMRTWATHIQHMEMLRMGHMSPAVASQLWLASWRQGVRELRAYQGAVRTVDASGRC